MATKRKPKTDAVRSAAMADIALYPAYILRGIVYLPHYHDRLFVSPGYGLTHWNTYQGVELRAMGGQMVKLPLLKRAGFEEYSQ